MNTLTSVVFVFGGRRVRNLLALSGERAREKAPAPCGCGCGQTFSLYPWQDIPAHPRKVAK